MRRSMLALAALAGAAATTAANATVYFTFDDPSTAKELTYTAGNAGGDGSLTYSGATTVDLVVDASEDGFGIITYAATLTMNLTVGAAGIGGAPLLGSFSFSVGGDDILVGTVNAGGGSMSGFGGVGGLWFTDAISSGAFAWEAFGDLSTQIGGGVLASTYNASFALSNITPFFGGVNSDGYFNSFTANVAFVGDAIWAVPSPGSAALFSIAGLVVARRRR